MNSNAELLSDKEKCVVILDVSHLKEWHVGKAKVINVLFFPPLCHHSSDLGDVKTMAFASIGYSPRSLQSVC